MFWILSIFRRSFYTYSAGAERSEVVVAVCWWDVLSVPGARASQQVVAMHNPLLIKLKFASSSAFVELAALAQRRAPTAVPEEDNKNKVMFLSCTCSASKDLLVRDHLSWGHSFCLNVGWDVRGILMGKGTSTSILTGPQMVADGFLAGFIQLQFKRFWL